MRSDGGQQLCGQTRLCRLRMPHCILHQAQQVGGRLGWHLRLLRMQRRFQAVLQARQAQRSPDQRSRCGPLLALQQALQNCHLRSQASRCQLEVCSRVCVQHARQYELRHDSCATLPAKLPKANHTQPHLLNRHGASHRDGGGQQLNSQARCRRSRHLHG